MTSQILPRAGQGYVAGEGIDLGNSLELSLAVGTVKLGETFDVTALVNSDTSGFLAAAGVNALFAGGSADTMTVRSEIIADPHRLAVSLAPGGNDNANAVRIGDLVDTPLAALGNVSPGDYLRTTVTDIAQSVYFREARQTALESAVQQISAERDRLSGVDINEEAANLLMYQRMYEACAKFMSVQSETLGYLMGMI